jgi:hypothetical protein
VEHHDPTARRKGLTEAAAEDAVLTLRDLLELIPRGHNAKPEPATLAATHLKLGHAPRRV